MPTVTDGKKPSGGNSNKRGKDTFEKRGHGSGKSKPVSQWRGPKGSGTKGGGQSGGKKKSG